MSEPVRVLVLDTVMDRGGAETMTMNYLRRMDRSKVQYDFLVNRDYKAAYEDEIAELGGKVYRMCPLYPQYFDKYKRQFRVLRYIPNIGLSIPIWRNAAISRCVSLRRWVFQCASPMHTIVRWDLI